MRCSEIFHYPKENPESTLARVFALARPGPSESVRGSLSRLMLSESVHFALARRGPIEIVRGFLIRPGSTESVHDVAVRL